MKRIGILTGGGDCPGLNAVIRAAVRTLIRDYDLQVVGIQLGFEGLLTKAIVPLTLESIRGILPKGGTLLRTTNRGNPFEYPLPGGGSEDRSAEVLQNIRELGIDGIIAIGGDGTLRIAQRLCEMGIPMVAVPKTIDNDLAATDYTFGFHTAVAVATDAVDRLHTTAESHDRVMILEVMGRNAGWIALYSGIAGGADIILLPEIPYRPEVIVETIRERQSEGAKFDIMVVAEGAKRQGGEEAYLDKATRRLGGIAYQVAAD
ncbi:MAG TPA: ATP-dependent 6-phosphofructokinase, partial [Thermoanaerobaculia bacterium]|nr:ATP-dependent 6-phosphofructokinase [Thermoanaerobaculia bacterium]